MSEFFKSAIKCDVSAAQHAPMYVDIAGVMEEKFKHERLVEQTLKTKLLLDELDAKELRLSKTEQQDLLGPGRFVSGPYKEPSATAAAAQKDPSERHPGARAILRGVESRMNLWRQQLESHSQVLKQHESSESRTAIAEETARRQDAERELSALVLSRQLAAHEAQEQQRKALLAEEQAGRRVHPIDVLQRKIAADLLEEVAEGTRQVQLQLAAEDRGIDEVLEAEQMRMLKYKYQKPCLHVPAAW